MPHTFRNHAFSWIVSWAILFFVWLLYVDTLAPAELAVGAVAAACAATASEAVRGHHFAAFQPYASWLLQVWRLPGYLITGTGVLTWVLIARFILRKEIPAVIRAVPFDAGGDDARSAARRALAVTLTTMPPNFVVIGIDQEKGVMLIHQVMATDVPGVAKVLGAK